eukprot:3496735-Heterocapsa_arctica.AAC.1
MGGDDSPGQDLVVEDGVEKAVADKEEVQFFGFPFLGEASVLPVRNTWQKPGVARSHGLDPELVRLDVPVSPNDPRSPPLGRPLAGIFLSTTPFVWP